MIDTIKNDLRISHNKLDKDINDNIESCILNLNMAGVYPLKKEDKNYDELIKTAIKYYCRWVYDFNGKGEVYQKAFENLKMSLSLSGDYNVQPGN